MAPLSNTARFFEVALCGAKSELPKCGIWGNVRYYPMTALYNSWACVSRNPLRGESRLNRKQNTVCLLCPQLLIIKMEFAPQSNPCLRTSPSSLIYDYLHVESCQWLPMEKKQIHLAFYFFLFFNAPTGKPITKLSLSGPRAESDVAAIQIMRELKYWR